MNASSTIWSPLRRWSARTNEQLHADHGRAAAAEIDASLLGFSADCQQLVSAANEQARAIMAAWGAKDRDLDQLTDHGRHPERYP